MVEFECGQRAHGRPNRAGGGKGRSAQHSTFNADDPAPSRRSYEPALEESKADSHCRHGYRTDFPALPHWSFTCDLLRGHYGVAIIPYESIKRDSASLRFADRVYAVLAAAYVPHASNSSRVSPFFALRLITVPRIYLISNITN